MFTYVPEPSIRRSAACLPDAHLEKSWDAAYETLRSLVGCRRPITGPLIMMWRGYETALANYALTVSDELASRGYLLDIRHDLIKAFIKDGPLVMDDQTVKIDERFLRAGTPELRSRALLPMWFGWVTLHESHRLAIESEDIRAVVFPWKGGDKWHTRQK